MTERLGRLAITVVLLGGAALFLLPLVWMISTSLKPIEQTMTMPPRWLPRAYYVQIDGEQVEAKFVRRLEEPALLVRTEDGETFVVAEGSAVDLETAQVLKRYPASPQHPWLVLAPPDTSAADQWVILPADQVEAVIDPRWGNYPGAIEDMGIIEQTPNARESETRATSRGPLGFVLRLYEGAKRYMFLRYTWNTLILCVLTVTGTVLSSALVAYGFSRIDWPGRNKVFIVVLATMMVPFPVLMVPLYALFRELGWIGTLRPLWVPAFLASAFNVFLLRQFFMTIPRDLSEAARIDGCDEWTIFWRIIMPLSKPALMVVGLFQFLFTWNDFLGPLIFLTDQSDFTLALGLQFYQSRNAGTEWHYLMAASAMIVAPIILLFFIAQRYFVEGITLTGIKG